MNKNEKQLSFSLDYFKTCNSCQKEKHSSEFVKMSLSKDGFSSYCKTCIRAKQKEKYQNNYEYRAKVSAISKKWYEENKDKVLKRTKDYCQIYNKIPWKKIPANLQKYLRKYTNFRSVIGMKSNQLKIHIESLWLPGMTWENYGKIWVINKIKPVNQFNLNDPKEVMKINHFSNLKPSFLPKSNKNVIKIN